LKYIDPPISGDPSIIAQNIERLNVNIHCCRYWWLNRWKHKNLSFPFWRLYWNANEGAYIFLKDKIYLTPDKIIIIPPFTPFSTDLNMTPENEDYGLEGGWIKSKEIRDKSISDGNVLHFYLHFNLGYPFDNTRKSIYTISPSSEDIATIEQIIQTLIRGTSRFTLTESIIINKLIYSTLAKLPGDIWEEEAIDSRIFEVIKYMNRNLGSTVMNQKLASLIGMAANSFARFFRLQTGYSPNRYLTKIRIENACHLLLHTNLSLKQIAEDCGFFDRYYFTRVFNKSMNISPAKYRKEYSLKKAPYVIK